jgi:hypothetical protein
MTRLISQIKLNGNKRITHSGKCLSEVAEQGHCGSAIEADAIGGIEE